MSKPIKPNVTIPAEFAPNGVRTPFSNAKVQDGFDRINPDVLAGDNLNQFIDDTYKASNYALDLGDYVLGHDQLTNCILEAPNGVATYTPTSITVKQGLKVLLPNGRNADGTLNNTEYTVDEDITMSYSDIIPVSNTLQRIILFSPLSNEEQYIIASEIRYFYIQTQKPTTTYGWWYNPITNYCYEYDDSVNDWIVTDEPYIIIGYNENNGSTFTDFRPLTTVQLADTNLAYITDIGNSNIAHSASPMPANENPVVDLTIPASGSNMTAPADGIFYVNWSNSNTGGWVYLNNSTIYMTSNPTRATYANIDYASHVHCSKGDNVIITYDAVSSMKLRFIPLNGAISQVS